MDVVKLKQNIDCFSLELKEKNNLDEVTVGGKILSVIELDDQNFYIQLDDYLSSFYVLLKREAYEYFLEHIVVGNYIKVKGILSLFQVLIKEQTEKNFLVCGYEIEKIS
jgi:hypothetical protein